MAKKTRKKQPVSWKTIEHLVLEGLDLENQATRHAVEEWKKHVKDVQTQHEADRMIHAVSSEESIQALVEFFRSDIAVREAKYKAKMAREMRALAFARLRVALAESEAAFADERLGIALVPEMLGIVRISPETKRAALNEMIERAIALAEGREPDEDTRAAGEDRSRLAEFSADLKMFLDANGEEGKELVLRICKDTEFAKQAMTDPELPGVVAFLAQVVVRAKTPLKIVKRRNGRPIGFMRSPEATKKPDSAEASGEA